MKTHPVKAILSSLLAMLFLSIALSGILLYYGKTGLVMGIARNTLRETHFWSAVLMCLLVPIHFFLNRRLFYSEMTALFRRKEGR